MLPGKQLYTGMNGVRKKERRLIDFIYRPLFGIRVFD